MGATREMPPGRSEPIRSSWQSYSWCVVGGLALAGFAMGAIGFEQRADFIGEAHSLRDSMYRSIQPFVLESGGFAGNLPQALEVARVVAPLAFAYTAARALVALFRDQVRTLACGSSAGTSSSVGSATRASPSSGR